MVTGLNHILSELERYNIPLYLIDELEQAIKRELERVRYEGYNKGHEDGYEEGYEEGHEEGYEEGYEDGYEKAKSELNS